MVTAKISTSDVKSRQKQTGRPQQLKLFMSDDERRALRAQQRAFVASQVKVLESAFRVLYDCNVIAGVESTDEIYAAAQSDFDTAWRHLIGTGFTPSGLAEIVACVLHERKSGL